MGNSVDLAGHAGVPNMTPWQLDTDDTRLTMTIVENRPAIVELKNPTQGWNWTATPTTVPLPDRVFIRSQPYFLDWRYRGAQVDSRAGTQVTLDFTSDAPNLTLKSIWRARPGAGPVEYSTTVTNDTGDDVTFQYVDIVSADMSFVADAEVTLCQFDKVVFSPDKSVPNSPVRCNRVMANSDLVSNTNNDPGAPSDIPFRVFAVGETHGLYLGYEWSFGTFHDLAGQDPRQLRHRAYLWDDGKLTVNARSKLTIPTVFIGTYLGDLDAAGNSEKRWFWQYKVPQTLRDSPDEPLVEYCLSDSEAENTWFHGRFPNDTFGGELAKVDVGWMSQTDGWYGRDIVNWLPNSMSWPSGMIAGDLAHANGLKLSLYMSNTYRWNDLSTAEGRKAQLSALAQRYDDGWYDYYRSDFFCERSGPGGIPNYSMHEGYMEVLDSMISTRPNFRYEHCSGGGTLKDFSTLQRTTFMTTEDSAIGHFDAASALDSTGMTGHKRSYFSASYAINPAQLKADVRVNESQDASEMNYYLRLGYIGASMLSPLNFGATHGYLDVGGGLHSAYVYFTRVYQTKARPVLRGADVYHILPIVGGTDWDGFQLFNQQLNQGFAVIWKPIAGTNDTRTVRFKGLDRSATYRLTFEERHDQNCARSGAELMDSGLVVKGMTGTYASDVVWINFPAVTLVNDASSEPVFTGAWRASTARGRGDLGDDVHESSSDGASFSLSFNGTGVELVGEKNADQGILEIAIDGGKPQFVNTYHSGLLVQQTIFSALGLESGTHVVTARKISGAVATIDAARVYSD